MDFIKYTIGHSVYVKGEFLLYDGIKMACHLIYFQLMMFSNFALLLLIVQYRCVILAKHIIVFWVDVISGDPWPLLLTWLNFNPSTVK